MEHLLSSSTYINSCSCPNNSPGWVLILPFNNWENEGSQRISNWPKVTSWKSKPAVHTVSVSRVWSPVVVDIPDMTRIQSRPSARHNGEEKYKRFYEIRSFPEYSLLELDWTWNRCLPQSLISSFTQQIFTKAFLMPGQTLGTEEGIVLRDLTAQLGNAHNKQIIGISWRAV